MKKAARWFEGININLGIVVLRFKRPASEVTITKVPR